MSTSIALGEQRLRVRGTPFPENCSETSRETAVYVDHLRTCTPTLLLTAGPSGRDGGSIPLL